MIGAVVLAAGRSERMGKSKADVVLPDGTSFLDAVLTTLGRLRIDPVRIVVAPADPRAGSESGGIVVNPDPSRGMLSSVQCGLRALPDGVEAVVLWPVDHPRVEPGTLATLVAAQRAHRAPVVVPLHAGRRGHPVLFAGTALAELSALPVTGNAAEIVHAHADRLEIEVGDAGVTDDIDDAEAYTRVFGRTP